MAKAAAKEMEVTASGGQELGQGGGWVKALQLI